MIPTTYAHAGAHPVSAGACGRRRGESGGGALAPSLPRRRPKGPHRARARGVRTPPPVELQAQPVIDIKKASRVSGVSGPRAVARARQHAATKRVTQAREALQHAATNELHRPNKHIMAQ